MVRKIVSMMASYREDCSSTAKDSDTESISLEEKAGLLETDPTSAPKSSKVRHRSPCHLLLTSIMAIANVILGALLVIQFQSSHAKTMASPPMTHGHQHAHPEKKPIPIPMGGLPRVDAHPDWLPPEEWRTEEFRLHQIYGEEPVGTAKEAWESLIPKGKGFIVVKNDTELPNMPGFRYSGQEQYAMLAVFHQMHCLYITFKAYWNARAGNFDEIAPEHLIHCWDYLRQSIQCAGDTSLEWTHQSATSKGQSSGWGYQHTCKNFDAIFNWAESHRYTNKAKID